MSRPLMSRRPFLFWETKEQVFLFLSFRRRARRFIPKRRNVEGKERKCAKFEIGLLKTGGLPNFLFPDCRVKIGT